MNYGREVITLVEIDQPLCARTYGTAPCAAVLGTTGTRKCFNTQATCQSVANYLAATLTLRFAHAQDGVMAYGPLLPSLVAPVTTTAAAINLAGMDPGAAAVGTREVVTLKFDDHRHSDHLVDPYRLQRLSGAAQSTGVGYDPYVLGTFWGKWLARNPYHPAYKLRVYRGFVGDAVSAMRVRRYLIDRIDVQSDGQVTLVAKDAFSLVEARKAVAPLASSGRLLANITNVAATLTLTPAGVGNLEYPASGFVVIGEEEMSFTRAADVLTITRGTSNTTAAAHTAEDLVQLVLAYAAQLAKDIVYDLLLNYTRLSPAQLPLSTWTANMAAVVDLYSTHIATPTPVLDLVGELSEQAGFTVFPDTATDTISMVALRAAVPTATLTDSKDMVDGSISVKRQFARRVSQVWVYYGQRVPVKSLNEKTNYLSRAISADLSAETQYGTPAIREVFSRWISQFGRASALNSGGRLLQMFRDPPLETHFRVRGDTWDGNLALGQFVTPLIDELQDAVGSRLVTTQAILSLERDENEFAVITQQVTLTAVDLTAERVIYVDNAAFNLNMRTVHDLLYAAPTGVETVRFVIGAGVRVGSTSTSGYAMDTGDWPAGVVLKLDNKAAGRLQGMGGGGGDVLAAPPYSKVGNPGGHALHARRAITVDNLGGEIWAGGGGGASDGVGGGSGGAGTNPGIVGMGVVNGLPGTDSSGGASQLTIVGSTGAGGGPGLAGGASTGSNAQAGGAPGNYITGNAFVTWTNNGDRRGGVVA